MQLGSLESLKPFLEMEMPAGLSPSLSWKWKCRDLATVLFETRSCSTREVIEGLFGLVTNLLNMGLISVDRKTSLLSHLQYPVSYKVVCGGFNTLNALKMLEVVLGRSLLLL